MAMMDALGRRLYRIRNDTIRTLPEPGRPVTLGTPVPELTGGTTSLMENVPSSASTPALQAQPSAAAGSSVSGPGPTPPGLVRAIYQRLNPWQYGFLGRR